MSKQVDTSESAMMYYQLLQQGVPPAQAFQQAFPNGLPKKPGPEDLAKDQQKQAIGGVAGSLAGALGTYYAIDALSGGAPEAIAATTPAAVTGAGAAGAGAAGAGAGGSALTSAAGEAGAGFAGQAGGAAGTAGTVGTEGAASTLGAAAPYLGLAGAGLGAYGLYNALDSNDKTSGALSGAALGGGLAAAAPLVGLGPVGWGGLALAAALGAGGGFGLTSLFGHESTRDVAKKHTGQLQGMGKDDAAWQNYVKGMRTQYNSAPPDPSKPFHGGKYGSWDEYKQAGLDAADLTGVYGNLKTFGPEWAKLSFDDQKKVTQGIIDAGLYNSKKGEVEISDPSRALQIRDSVLKGETNVIPRPPMGQVRPVARPTPGNMPQPNVPLGQMQQLQPGQSMPYPGVKPMPRPLTTPGNIDPRYGVDPSVFANAALNYQTGARPQGAQVGTKLPQVQPNNINLNPQQMEQMRKFGLKLVGALGQR